MTARADKYRFGLVPKRHFDPAAPLFVTRRFVFRGVTYERGARLPDDIHKGKRFALWHSNRATNTPVVHFDRRGRFVADGVPIAKKASTAPAAPASLPEATAQAAEGGAVSAEVTIGMPGIATQATADAVTDAELKRLTAPAAELPKPQPVSRRPNRSGR